MNKIFTCLMTLVVMMFAGNAMADQGSSYSATVKVSVENGQGTVYVGEEGQMEQEKSDKGDSAPTFEFNISATAAEGYTFVQWNDGDKNADRTVSVTGSTDGVTITYKATFAPITKVSANLQVTSAGVATFCAPFAVNLAAEEIDAKAYKAEVSGDFVMLSELTDGVIPAGTPVVLQSNTVINKTLEAEPTVTAETCTEGCLTGNLAAAKKEVAEGYYLLQNQEAYGLAWYRVANSGLYIGTNRCYLSKTAADARDYYTMDFDNTTGIDNIATEAKTKADGKYLVNGRIVIIKAGKVYELK